MIKATLNAWANELGVDPDTIRRALTAGGYPLPAAREEVEASKVFRAMLKPDEDPKRRLTLAQAIEQERINKIEAGELVHLGDVEKMLSELVTLPMRERLLSLPSTLSVRCNPQTPDVARVALEQWSDETLKLLRDNLKPDDTEATS